MVNVGAMKTKRATPSAESALVEELTLARALEECLQAMEQGETDLDSLAGRYPEAQEEIRPLLDIAQQLRQRRNAGPPLAEEMVKELRARLLAHHPGG